MKGSKYKRKQVVTDVQAYQWDESIGETEEVFFHDTHPDKHEFTFNGKTGNWCVNTPNGTVKVQPGDWIVTRAPGDVYPCKPKAFEEMYEAAP
jgi:hypothetical protein